MYNLIQLYYFSGTGNAKNVANRFADMANSKGWQTENTNIATINRKHIAPQKEYALIGFLSPTHGFNFPPIMMHFLLRFPRSKGNKVFFINTRAGMKMGKLFLPGLSGIAQYFYALLLFFKGYKVVGMQSIDLPSNWISLHPGLKIKVVESIITHCNLITDKFATKILDGGTSFRALRDILQDLIITPVSVLYYLVGRFFFAKSFYANKQCTRCDVCIKTCPVKAISVKNNRPYWTLHCESCMKCMNNCPEKAIQTAHGFIAMVVFIGWFLLNVILLAWMAGQQAIPIVSKITTNGVGHFLLSNGLFLFMLFLLYRLFHFMLQFTFFERLINHTSLTYYKFWRRYKFRKVKN